jgi:hypothetical protein
MTILAAIQRVNALALAMTSVTIKSAPDYPIENADPFPMVITYLQGGTLEFGTADTLYLFPTLAVEFHFSRVNLQETYRQINLVVPEFSKRLAGDPTLNGNVSTVQAGDDNPLAFSVRPFEWGSVKSQMVLFTLPYKVMETPTT